MPLLTDFSKTGPRREEAPAALFPVCGNPLCHTGRIHLWRKRRTPIFAGQWTCSPQCLEETIRATLGRGLEAMPADHGQYRHRVPLGLILLSQGVITPAQLRQALAAQASSGEGRIGEWLVRLYRIEEGAITRALARQWNCPVLALEPGRTPEVLPAMPRLFIDAFDALPLRLPGERTLFVVSQRGVDHCLQLALATMSDRRVEPAILGASEFARIRAGLADAGFAPARFLEAFSLAGLARTLCDRIEEASPREARLVRVREYFWLRMWTATPRAETAGKDCQDIVCDLAQD